MSNSVTEKVRSNPKFSELKSKRARFAWTLAAIVLGVYYSFMMVVAFAPKSLTAKIGEGWTLSIGYPIVAVIIVGAWLLTGLYIRRANGEFETLTRDIVSEAKK
ncbi:MAG: DUF485 domain-containing protein [Hyphomicrobiales bacterium]|nr:DUF485 domain-containing protein [Hyphomicrobiales bacterium]